MTNSSHSGAYSAFGPNVSSISDQRLVLNTPVVIPADASAATLSFWHKHHFDVDALAQTVAEIPCEVPRCIENLIERATGNKRPSTEEQSEIAAQVVGE